MSVHRMISIWLLTMLGLAPLPALAQMNYDVERPYFGLAGGVSQPDLPSRGEFDARVLNGAPGTSSLDDTGSAWGAQVGYRWGAYLAAEFAYVDFGKTEYRAEPTGASQRDSIRYLNSGVTLAVLGIVPLGEKFDLYARGGVYYIDTRVRLKAQDLNSDATLASFENKVHTKNVFFGAGVNWNIRPSFALRLDYEHFLDVGKKEETGQFNIDLLMLGVLFR